MVLIVAGATWLLLHYDVQGRPPAPQHGSPSASGTTQVITVVAVDAGGHPANGYREVRPTQDPGHVAQVFGCEVSPAAVAGDIYDCAPSAAGADVCWPSPPGSLLCLDYSWDQGLHRVSVTDPLPHVQPTATPAPFALLLDDGTRCRLRNGGAWGGRDDGLVGAYACPDGKLSVLVATTPHAEAIDRSRPLWTVKVGSLGAGDAHLPPPQTHTVTTAWLAGTAGPA